MISLRYPLLLLLLLPALWGAWRAAYRWGIPHERPTSAFEHYTARILPFMLAILLVMAGAGPEWREEVRGIVPVVDFAVVLDGSSSMKAVDGQSGEDRWTAARNTLKAFIAGRSQDRFSLILFSAHPVTLSPLSADHLRLWRMLDRLELDSRDDGTAIGTALMTAVRRLSASPARSRVILLLTDGAENAGRVSGEQAALEAKSQGIRIHTILLGKPGQESLYPFDGGIARVKVQTDPDSLKQIASLSGGEYFPADDPAGLARSLKAVNTLEKTAMPVDAPSEGTPLAGYFLMASGLFGLPLAADICRKRGKKGPLWLLQAEARPGQGRQDSNLGQAKG